MSIAKEVTDERAEIDALLEQSLKMTRDVISAGFASNPAVTCAVLYAVGGSFLEVGAMIDSTILGSSMKKTLLDTIEDFYAGRGKIYKMYKMLKQADSKQA